MLARLNKFLAQPHVCRRLFLAVALDMGAWYMLSGSGHTPIALGGCVTASGCLLRGGTRCFFPHRAVVARTPEGIAVLDIYSPKGQAIWTLSDESAMPLGRVWVSHRIRTFGLLAPAFAERRHDLVSSVEGLNGPAESAAVRAGYAALMPGWGMTGNGEVNWPALVAAGDGTAISPRPIAIIHDLVWAVAAIFAVRSFSLQSDRRYALFGPSLSLRERRAHAGLCPDCGYEMSGLQGRCPECGEGTAPHDPDHSAA
jgi:hypothetical protein